jgi:hypothetical protein
MPLIQLFLDICLFRKGPQDVPASQFLLGLILSLNLLVSAGLLLMEADPGQAIVQAACAMGLMFAFLYGLLKITRLDSRFLQTASAALATDAVFTLAAAPLMGMGQVLPDWQGFLSLLVTALMLWAIAVLGHILREALNLPYLAGFLLALAYTAGSLRIMMAWFPSLT